MNPDGLGIPLAPYPSQPQVESPVAIPRANTFGRDESTAREVSGLCPPWRLWRFAGDWRDAVSNLLPDSFSSCLDFSNLSQIRIRCYFSPSLIASHSRSATPPTESPLFSRDPRTKDPQILSLFLLLFSCFYTFPRICSDRPNS